MKNFELHPFRKIDGIGAASGLVLVNKTLFIISDNSTFLYQYDLNNNTLDKIKLLAESREKLSKKDKADFESITLFNNKLYIHGSGSTKERDLRIKYDLVTKEIQEKDVSKLHKRLRETVGLDKDELNIEGVIVNADDYYFFQRGNGVQAKNGIFKYSKETKNVMFYSIELPEVNGVKATFTDAALVDDTVYFLAACENTSSSYNDGEIYGSFIGSVDLTNGCLIFIRQISEHHKFEGLTLFEKNSESLHFLLCEDNDTEDNTTSISKLTLS